MTARPLKAALLMAALALAGPAFAADDPDPEFVRLAALLGELDNDPELSDKGRLERFKARQALAGLQAARRRDRDHALLVAGTRVEAAQAAAQAELLTRQALQLDRERDQITLEASRRDAEMARREADRLRRQAQIREEQAQRQAELDRLAAEQSAAVLESAQAQTGQAMKLAEARAREAELARQEVELSAAIADEAPASGGELPPARRSGNRTTYTLAGTSFASGSASLTAGAKASLRRLAAEPGLAGRSLRVVAHTDSQGGDAANLALSQQRAQAVVEVLAAAGLPGNRLQAVGKGESDPLVDNATAAGRAQNRRVEIIVQ